MKKITFLFTLLLVSGLAMAQWPNTDPLPRNMTGINVIKWFGLPNDTITIPVALRGKPHLAEITGTLYLWSVGLQRWVEYSSSGTTTTTNIYNNSITNIIKIHGDSCIVRLTGAGVPVDTICFNFPVCDQTYISLTQLKACDCGTSGTGAHAVYNAGSLTSQPEGTVFTFYSRDDCSTADLILGTYTKQAGDITDAAMRNSIVAAISSSAALVGYTITAGSGTNVNISAPALCGSSLNGKLFNVEFGFSSSGAYFSGGADGGPTVVTCDTTTLNSYPLYNADNWTSSPIPGLVQAGNSPLKHNTNFYTGGYVANYMSAGYGRYSIQYSQVQSPAGTPGILSYENTNAEHGSFGVKLSTNYTDSANTNISQYKSVFGLGNRGYYTGVNFTGLGVERMDSLDITNQTSNSSSKNVGVFYHTLDQYDNNHGLSFYVGDSNSNHGSSKYFDRGDTAFALHINTDKSFEFPGYNSTSPFLSSDTGTYKPPGLGPKGELVRMNYWPGGGGGGDTNFANTNLTFTGNRSHTLGVYGYEMNATNGSYYAINAPFGGDKGSEIYQTFAAGGTADLSLVMTGSDQSAKLSISDSAGTHQSFFDLRPDLATFGGFYEFRYKPSTGAIQIYPYGLGGITGTPTFTLSVDALGNVIETPVAETAKFSKIFTDITQPQSSGTGATTVCSFNIPANTLVNNGDVITMFYAGSAAGTGAGNSAKPSFNSHTAGFLSFSGDGDWQVVCRIQRISSTDAAISWEFKLNGSSMNVQSIRDSAVDWTNPIVTDITLTAGTSGFLQVFQCDINKELQ